MNWPHMQIQICFFPLFTGGFYLTCGWRPLNRFLRIGLCVIDFRVMFDSGILGGLGPIPYEIPDTIKDPTILEVQKKEESQ